MCYLATVEPAVTGQTSTVINYYTDLNGEDALIYAYRSGYPFKLTFDGENFAKTTLDLPGTAEFAKGHSDGAFPLIWDGKELIIYPLMPDYRDGWAIAEAGAEAPIAYFEATAAANPNGYQNDWLNAEVNEDGSVTIYQYMPGLCLRVFKLTAHLIKGGQGLTVGTVEQASVQTPTAVLETGAIAVLLGIPPEKARHIIMAV